MSKAFEKVLKKIEEKRNKYQRLADGSYFDGWNEEDIKYSAKAEMCEELKEIVQEVAEEYNGCWIPCSERLPEAGKRYLVSAIWKDKDFEKSAVYDAVYGSDGLWHSYNYEPVSYKVIAWQPLPEQFKERD